MKNVFRRLAAAAIAALVLCSLGSTPKAQSVPAIDKKVQFLLPQWFRYLGATQEEVNQQAALIRSRIGEGPRVKVGFTTYVVINMSPVDPADTIAVRAALAQTFSDIDNAITRARTANIPICISFITAVRERFDAAQTAAQAADKRSMQWYTDDTLADGWVSLSRYSRKQRALEAAFLAEVGRYVAARMLLYPDTLVAVSGDGETELSYYKSLVKDGTTYPTEAASLLTDYSPFAIKEFADWVRNAGLYASGQSFAGEGYSLASRYAGDTAPGSDNNGDGRTFNGDFATSFTSWNLKENNWSLNDPFQFVDPGAIPSVPGGNTSVPAPSIAGGFDAPRVLNKTDAYWKVWDEFRQRMVHRYNLAFAKAMTTAVDTASGATIPAERYFSDQIPADQIFTNVSTSLFQPNGVPSDPGFRYVTSASPWWTADISPFGSAGFTSFNVNAGRAFVPNPPGPDIDLGDIFYRTFAAIGPLAGPLSPGRNLRFGLFEWNPSVGKTCDLTQPTGNFPKPCTATSRDIYDREMALVEKYRPALLVPFSWQESFEGGEILDTPFEQALHDWVLRRNNIALTLSKTKVYGSTLVDGSVRSPGQEIRVTGEPGESPVWNASTASDFLDIVKAADGRSFTVALKQQSYAAGTQSATVVVTPTTAGYAATTLTFEVTASSPAATKAPIGSFDTPADLALVTGEVGFTGWAVDDVGVKSIDIYRAPLTGEATQGNGLVFIGSASPVEGARPDIEATYGTIPANTQAGWGYMLLSNFLPNAGNGIFSITVEVTDLDGHTVRLGTRRIDCRNATTATPFGTIDTPLQGQIVSGTIVNFGWTLTPLPNTIAFDGSGIDVVIDNVIVGHPVYNNYRADIAGLFPGLNNTGTPGGGGAIGYFYIDTTTLTNGLHTISWIVRDSGGGATGMGSRYFTVANP